VVEAWGVDAKDQVSASLLGREFAWPSSIDCQQRFLALPTHRAEQAGYVADLEAELDGRVAGVQVVSERELIAKVKARARRLAP
jgi:REase associating with pPIWI_RE